MTEEYHRLLNEILMKGTSYEDPRRKGVKRIQIKNYTIKHNLFKSFPAITTKKLAWKSIVSELLWFLKGDTNIKYLLENKNPIWNKDAYNNYLKKFNAKYPEFPQSRLSQSEFVNRIKNSHRGDLKNFQSLGGYNLGDVGPIYGHQWRDFNSQDVDQLSDLIFNMIDRPMGTDHIVMAWNPVQKEQMGLPPCHFGFIIEMIPLTVGQRATIGNIQGHLSEEDMMKYCDQKKIPTHGFTLKWMQRSVDTFLGLPFNIASYALLAHILGKITNTVPMELVGVLSNVHLYSNSFDAVYELLERDPLKYKPGHLKIEGDIDHIDDIMKVDMFTLPEYESYPALKVEMLARDI